MISSKKYVILSLELHLFFARIMKEHLIFLKAALTPKNDRLSKEAECYMEQFEKILLDTIKMSNGRIRESVVESGELLTEYTLLTEKKTHYYTGININTKITEMEKELDFMNDKDINSKTRKYVKQLNNKVIKALNGLIEFKTGMLDEISCCKLFLNSYPSFLKHLIHEAKLYRSYVNSLEMDEDIDYDNIRKTEIFWDDKMMEHALFIRGLLDPKENKLINKADEFAEKFNELLEKARDANDKTIEDITKDTLLETIKLRDFKKSGVEGIINCKIKSMILPLLADHVLREANHFIRILNNYDDCL
ncbi:DUF2935 domain-containing protein [Clostridium baratii]|uniref:Protein of uncharacterized function (DUF2935) n=1 Tax=Clostridium baratii TaxID=1561 RepID=A0A174PU91_9CLOT|nr:DUF2935 domain-containing protein [Clostridium baratii]CUP64543.1 Protein of uncharacterised function (DUF2935) [Clostridium baratii]